MSATSFVEKSGTLLDFQRDAVDFLIHPNEFYSKPHRLLSLGTGLGKTPTTCAAIQIKGFDGGIVLCPYSVKDDWRHHLIYWGAVKPEDIHVYEGSYDFAPVRKKWLILNYELLDYEIIRKQFFDKARPSFDVVVIDEAQRLKSVDSVRAARVLTKSKDQPRPIAALAPRVWMLSATFISNRAMEMWTIYKTLAPELIKPYTAYEDYGRYFCNGFQDGRGHWNFKGSSNIEELRQRSRGFLHLKTVDDVYQQMPEVIEEDVYFDVGTVIDPETKEPATDENTNLSKLRQLSAVHKAPYIVAYIKDWLESNPEEKVVLFAWHRELCEILRRELQSYGAMLVYGGINGSTRKEILSSFKISKVTVAYS